MEKHILEEYCDMKIEAADLRGRIDKDERQLEQMRKQGYVVSDTVKGTRKDGTIGPIKITGFPMPAYEKIEDMMKRRIRKLKILEEDLLEVMEAVEEYISRIHKSELRIIFRMIYIDDCTWQQVSNAMNRYYPHRNYTADSCRMKHNRYLEKENLKTVRSRSD